MAIINVGLDIVLIDTVPEYFLYLNKTYMGSIPVENFVLVPSCQLFRQGRLTVVTAVVCL